ncbi:hypothetical protein KL941_000697 [Ogataea angusta]|nr:hypothetical protein KL941_000697 [Ogataea angusta]
MQSAYDKNQFASQVFGSVVRFDIPLTLNGQLGGIKIFRTFGTSKKPIVPPLLLLLQKYLPGCLRRFQEPADDQCDERPHGIRELISLINLTTGREIQNRRHFKFLSLDYAVNIHKLYLSRWSPIENSLSDLITDPIDMNSPKVAAEPRMYWPSVFITPLGAPCLKMVIPPNMSPVTTPTVLLKLDFLSLDTYTHHKSHLELVKVRGLLLLILYVLNRWH